MFRATTGVALSSMATGARLASYKSQSVTIALQKSPSRLKGISQPMYQCKRLYSLDVHSRSIPKPSTTTVHQKKIQINNIDLITKRNASDSSFGRGGVDM